MMTSTYFIEIFGGNKLTVDAHINKFTQGNDPQEHINRCESEWKRIRYKDQRVWPHLFLSTLDDLPKKWYKIEGSQGDNFNWKTLKENFIKNFSFKPQQDH